MCIKILAKLGTLRLQEPDDAVAREVAGAVEGQMLEEMSQPLLVVTLVDGTGLDKQAVDGLATRRLVRIDIICQSVIQLTHTQLRVALQGLAGHGRQHGQARGEHDCFSHRVTHSVSSIKKTTRYWRSAYLNR